MSAIPRTTLQFFGEGGTSDKFAQFGSTVGGSTVFTKDIATLQANSAWGIGLTAEVYPSNTAAFLEEMNGLFYVIGKYLAYILQAGVPEWDTGTTYWANKSIVQANGGQLFLSLQDNNAGNAPPAGASNAFWQWMNPPFPAIPTVPGFGNALKANLAVATISTVQVNVTADILSVQGVVFPNGSIGAISLTPNISVSGLNGLDTGAVSANTWYAVHAIAKADGSGLAGLFSLSPTAPLLPAGYTKFRRVGWVRANGSSNIIPYRQAGDYFYYTQAAVISYTGASGSAFSFAAGLPPTCLVGIFNVFWNGVNAVVTWRPHGDATTPYDIGTGGGSSQAYVINLPVSSAQQADIVSGSGGYILTILGYYDPV